MCPFTAWQTVGHGIDVGSDRESEDSVIGSSLAFGFTALFSRSDSPTSAHAKRALVSEGHTLRWCPTTGRAHRRSRSVGVNRSRRSGARGACRRAGRRARLQRGTRCVSNGGAGSGRRSIGPTCASPPARRARARTTARRRSHLLVVDAHAALLRSRGAPRASTSPAPPPSSASESMRPRRAGGTRRGRSGACFALNTRSNSASAASPAPAPWYRSTTVRPSSRFAAFGCSAPVASCCDRRVDLARAARRSRTGSTWAAASSGIDISLPNCSAGGSATPT